MTTASRPGTTFFFILWVVALAIDWLPCGDAAEPTVERLGGTVLVYQVDENSPRADFRAEDLAAAVERRLDPRGAYNISVRPLGKSRIEISVPKAGDHQARLREIKALLAQTGVLEFKIVANKPDDEAAFKAAQDYIDSGKHDDVLKERAEKGLPPPPPVPADGKAFHVRGKGDFTYRWVELGSQERAQLDLSNDAAEGKASSEDRPGRDLAATRKKRWEEAAKHRNRTMLLENGQFLLYSRACQSRALPAAQRDEKKYEDFLLVRDQEEGKAVTGAYLADVSSVLDSRQMPAVNFRFGKEGGERFRDLTSQNLPDTPAEGQTFYRHLAIILDGQIMSAPRLISAISTNGQITGGFTRKEVDRLVTILRAGALPATLIPTPVSESEVKPNAGVALPPVKGR